MPLAKYERRALQEKLRKRIKEPKNLKKVNYVVIAVIVSLVSFLGYTFTGYTVQNEAKYDGFAKCLSEKDAKFFGAFWCSHCKEQKELFGSSVQYLNYIECDPKGENSQTDLCLEKNIKAYPTWEIDGNQYLGTLSVEKLADLSGCSLN